MGCQNNNKRNILTYWCRLKSMFQRKSKYYYCYTVDFIILFSIVGWSYVYRGRRRFRWWWWRRWWRRIRRWIWWRRRVRREFRRKWRRWRPIKLWSTWQKISCENIFELKYDFDYYLSWETMERFCIIVVTLCSR